MTRRLHVENAGETMGRRNRKGEPLAMGEALAPLEGDRVQASFQEMKGGGLGFKSLLPRHIASEGRRKGCLWDL